MFKRQERREIIVMMMMMWYPQDLFVLFFVYKKLWTKKKKMKGCPPDSLQGMQTGRQYPPEFWLLTFYMDDNDPWWGWWWYKLINMRCDSCSKIKTYLPCIYPMMLIQCNQLLHYYYHHHYYCSQFGHRLRFIIAYIVVHMAFILAWNQLLFVFEIEYGLTIKLDRKIVLQIRREQSFICSITLQLLTIEEWTVDINSKYIFNLNRMQLKPRIVAVFLLQECYGRERKREMLALLSNHDVLLFWSSHSSSLKLISKLAVSYTFAD